MGTSATYTIKNRNTARVGYTHFDGYPDYTGAILALDIINATPEELEKILQTKIVSEDDDVVLTPELRHELSPYAGNLNNGDDWYQILRETQGTIKPYTKEGLTYFLDFSDMEGVEDYHYVIDLENETFTIESRGYCIAKTTFSEIRQQPAEFDALEGYMRALVQ